LQYDGDYIKLGPEARTQFGTPFKQFGRHRHANKLLAVLQLILSRLLNQGVGISQPALALVVGMEIELSEI
jgi:hypothetical protein